MGFDKSSSSPSKILCHDACERLTIKLVVLLKHFVNISWSLCAPIMGNYTATSQWFELLHTQFQIGYTVFTFWSINRNAGLWIKSCIIFHGRGSCCVWGSLYACVANRPSVFVDAYKLKPVGTVFKTTEHLISSFHGWMSCTDPAFSWCYCKLNMWS